MIRKSLIGLCAAGLVSAMAGAASAQVTFSASYGAASLSAPGPASLVFTITNPTGSPLNTAVFNYLTPAPTNFGGGGFTGTCGLDPVGTGDRATLGVYADRGFQNVPANSTCVLTYTFTATAGTHTLSSPTLTYDGGGSVVMTAGANPTMVVAAPTPVPTLSEWGLILFGAILAGATALVLQRRLAKA
jgi:hypothetical protein